METLKRKAPDGPATADNASPLKAPRADAAGPPSLTTIAAAEPVACVHDVSYPEGYDASTSASRVLAGGVEGSEPAKKFPFQLDPFQAEAIRCLDNGESVMVRCLAFTRFLHWLSLQCLKAKFSEHICPHGLVNAPNYVFLAPVPLV